MFDSYIRSDLEVSDQAEASEKPRASVTIFPNRSRFESGVSRILGSTCVNPLDCAVLYVALEGGGSATCLQTAAERRKLLNFVGNTLRSKVHTGALAYLGKGRFAVLLQDVDVSDAVVYARSILTAISDIRLQGDDGSVTVDACIGGIMIEGWQDGAALLDLAQSASCFAGDSAGYRVHMVHTQEGKMYARRDGLSRVTDPASHARESLAA